jgi:hypothetical protein
VAVGAADIDRCGLGAGYELGDAARRKFGDAECLGEIVAGAPGHDRERAAASRLDDGVGDSTAGAVAADGDDGLESAIERAAGEGFLIARRRSLVGRGDVVRGERGADGWYGAPYSAAPGRRVDDEADAVQMWLFSGGFWSDVEEVLTSS